MIPTWFKSATGSASVAFIAMALVVWALLPFGHPVYAGVVPPVIAAGVAFAVYRVRRARAATPSIRNHGER